VGIEIVTLLYCSQGHENPSNHRFCLFCGEALTPPLQNQEGLLGGRYRILRQLGQGGFGRTYLAEDTNRFQEYCVLKEFDPQVHGSEALSKAEELFQREAGILYRLEHPQIPRFREIFRASVNGGRLFLVQDYVDGDTYLTLLRQRQQQGTCFAEDEVKQLVYHLLPVLAYIHSLGVVHRDISPDNLICRRSDRLPVLIDFGGVKRMAATVISQTPGAVMPAQPTLLGKIGYAPTEQMSSGEAYPHSDLYALAMTALVLLTGREPQDLLGADRRQWHSMVRLSSKFTNILERMLSPYPEQRYPTATAVIEAFGPEAAIAVEGGALPILTPESTATQTLAVSPARASTPVGTRRSKGGFRLLGVGLLLAGLAVGGWVFGDRYLKARTPEPSPTVPEQSEQNNIPPEPEFSATEKARKEALIQQRQRLGIEESFLVALVNETFYSKNAIGRESKDEAYRKEWDAIAQDYLTRLEKISQAARSRLGRYTNADLEKRRNEVNQINLSSRTLNDLTDAQFAYLMPEQPKQGKLSAPMMQVWQAIAAEQLAQLKAGKNVSRLNFSSGASSQQVEGDLQPGQGKVYLAALEKDQTVQLNLRAEDQSTRLSFYPPTSERSPLLEDAQATEWSGKLQDSGLYEIVIIPNSNQGVDFSLKLEAEAISSPSPTPTTTIPPVEESP